MKKQIFLYLFVFSLLIILFQYVTAKNVFAEMNYKLDKYETLNKKFKDSIVGLRNTNINESHFNLKNNEDAISYFEKSGYDVSTLIPYIKDELYTLNEKKGAHPLVSYSSSEGRKMMINTVKILNHKWIIADFSDGEYWGEILIKYELTEDKKVTFKCIDSFLYPFD